MKMDAEEEKTNGSEEADEVGNSEEKEENTPVNDVAFHLVDGLAEDVEDLGVDNGEEGSDETADRASHHA